MNITGVSIQVPVQSEAQAKPSVRPQLQAAQPVQQVGASRPDGDGDHGVEATGGATGGATGQLINALA